MWQSTASGFVEKYPDLGCTVRFVYGHSIRRRPPGIGAQNSRFAGVPSAWWYSAAVAGRSRECAMNLGIRTAGNQGGDRTRGRACLSVEGCRPGGVPSYQSERMAARSAEPSSGRRFHSRDPSRQGDESSSCPLKAQPENLAVTSRTSCWSRQKEQLSPAAIRSCTPCT